MKDAIANIWTECMGTQDESADSSLDRAMLWSAVAAVEPPMPSICNRRVPTNYALGVAADTPDPKVKDQPTTTIKTHNRTERVDRGTETRTVTNTERLHKRTYGLTSRAAEFGAKIKHDYRRIVGVLESGDVNRKWVIAICRWLMSQPDLSTLQGKWTGAMKKESTLTPGDAKTRSRQIVSTIRLWAAQKDDVKDFEPSSEAKEPANIGPTILDTPVVDDQDLGVTFVLLFINYNII